MKVFIDNFPSYMIYDDGRIESYRGTGCKPQAQVVAKLLKPTIDHRGYHYVTLCNENCRKRFFVHKLVASSFISNPLNLPQVNHIDGNKNNNKADNLEWCTNQSNHDHARATGLYDSQLKSYVFMHPRGFRVDVNGLSSFCKAHGLNPSHMSAVASGKLSQHKGWTAWQ